MTPTTRSRPARRAGAAAPVHHVATLGAPRQFGGGAAPMLLQRSDEDFIAGLLADLGQATGRAALPAQRAQARSAQGLLKLFQPLQRQFHLALLSCWCEQPGQPRVDRARIAGGGLVLRRVGADGRREGWMHAEGRVRGWLPLSMVGGDAADPDPARRAAQAATGVADLDRALAAVRRDDPGRALQEVVQPLFVAPPEVVADAGETLLYGLVSTTSSEHTEPVPALSAADGFGPDDPLFRAHLVSALQGNASSFPFAGRVLVAGWADAVEAVGDTAPAGVSAADHEALRVATSTEGARMRRLLGLLRQLAIEFDAFGSGPAVAALQARLRDIRLPLVQRPGETTAHTVEAFGFLRTAAQVLLNRTSTAAPEMPVRWPELDAADTRALQQALQTALVARAAGSTVAAGRFDDPDARYVLRGFVRLKPEGGCPERIVWSGESAPFVIAPWYDSAGAPPVQISMPDPTDRDALRALKPNVAFVVPPAMQNLLNGSAKDLLEGKGSTGTLGITWICSFSIPIITICAFLVLNIFLTLFNIVFGWLFFLKICLPLPKFGNKPPGSP